MEGLIPYTINVKGQLMDLSEPQVMGILNITPDSFFAASRQQTDTDILNRAQQILDEGGSMIDIGAYSSRPGATVVSPKEEFSRLSKALKLVRETFPDAVISVDTFRSNIARMCVEEFQVDIINDISGGEMDHNMFDTIADLNIPYIIMHMQGTPQNMQSEPHYHNLIQEICFYFSKKVQQLHDRGMKDIILDPGFGFGKTIEHNYELMDHLQDFQIFELPLLVGISRKSMIYKSLGGTPDSSLNGTTVLNTISLMKGANILRVHDVKECVEVVKLVKKMKECSSLTFYNR